MTREDCGPPIPTDNIAAYATHVVLPDIIAWYEAEQRISAKRSLVIATPIASFSVAELDAITELAAARSTRRSEIRFAVHSRPSLRTTSRLRSARAWSTGSAANCCGSSCRFRIILMGASRR